MMSLMSLATSCRVLEVGSDGFSMAAAQCGARGSPGTTTRGLNTGPQGEGGALSPKHTHFNEKATLICVNLD